MPVSVFIGLLLLHFKSFGAVPVHSEKHNFAHAQQDPLPDATARIRTPELMPDLAPLHGFISHLFDAKIEEYAAKSHRHGSFRRMRTSKLYFRNKATANFFVARLLRPQQQNKPSTWAALSGVDNGERASASVGAQRSADFLATYTADEEDRSFGCNRGLVFLFGIIECLAALVLTLALLVAAVYRVVVSLKHGLKYVRAHVLAKEKAVPVEDAGGSGFSKMPFDVRRRIADDKFLKAKRILKELRGLDDTAAAGRCSRACRGSSTYAFFFLFLLASSSCGRVLARARCRHRSRCG